MRYVVTLAAALVVALAFRAVPSASDDIDPRNLAGTWALNAWLTDSSDQIQREIRADLGPPIPHPGLPIRCRPAHIGAAPAGQGASRIRSWRGIPGNVVE